MCFGSIIRKVPPRLYLIVFFWRSISTPRGSNKRNSWITIRESMKMGFYDLLFPIYHLRFSSSSSRVLAAQMLLLIRYYRNREGSQTKYFIPYFASFFGWTFCICQRDFRENCNVSEFCNFRKWAGNRYKSESKKEELLVLLVIKVLIRIINSFLKNPEL